MTRGEAINWIINLTADIGKMEHQDLWHYEQALDEIRDMIEVMPLEQPEVIRCKDCWHYPGEFSDCPMIGWARNENDYCSKAEGRHSE